MRGQDHGDPQKHVNHVQTGTRRHSQPSGLVISVQHKTPSLSHPAMVMVVVLYETDIPVGCKECRRGVASLSTHYFHSQHGHDPITGADTGNTPRAPRLIALDGGCISRHPSTSRRLSPPSRPPGRLRRTSGWGLVQHPVT